MIVVAKTDPTKGAKGTSLIVVDTTMKGFTKGRRLKKMGLKGQDTSELFFDNVEVPAENLLGQEGNGFIYLMQELPWERMQIAIGAVSKAEAAIQWTMDYVRERKAFGKPVAGFQNTRFKLAECATQVQVARVFVDKCIELLLEGKLDAATAAMAKYWVSDLENTVIDECLQLHGGYGFMWEFPIARAYVDARVAADLRRHQRDHEGSHLQVDRPGRDQIAVIRQQTHGHRRTSWLRHSFIRRCAHRAARARRTVRCTR